MRPIRTVTTGWRSAASIALLGLTILAAGCAGDDASKSDAAGDRCRSQGGKVETRHPYWGTNLDQASWVELPGSIELCRFDASDDSRIYIDTVSLSSSEASLAAGAYLAKLTMPSTTDGGNPATLMCQDTVGGAATFGTGANGGGWVNLDDPVFTVVDLCVFPDGSAVDQWGIAYYSGNVIRGADLATKFAFDTSNVPPFFAGGSSS